MDITIDDLLDEIDPSMESTQQLTNVIVPDLKAQSQYPC